MADFHSSQPPETATPQAAETLPLERVRKLTNELCHIAENVLGEEPYEDADHSRPLALLHSISSLVGKMGGPKAYLPPLVTWTCALLEMLEDHLSRQPGSPGAVYQAIARLRGELGVPVDQRTGGKTSAKQLSDWTHHLGYQLFECAYLARATRALLREHSDAEKDEGLTGVSYLLTRLEKECGRLQNEVSEQSDRLAQGAIHG
jgi:hypothetical protein